MSRWNRYILTASPEQIRAAMDRWGAAGQQVAPIHRKLSRRWMRTGLDPVTGIYFARKRA